MRRAGEFILTNTEAIEVLSEIYMHVTVDSLEATIMVERHNKALDLAIAALKKTVGEQKNDSN